MKKLVVNGAKKLIGMQKVQGSKNSCLPIIISTILTKGENVLFNCPLISDSIATCEILNFLGCSTKFENSALIINTKNLNKTEIPNELMIKMRSSIIFLGAILARCKQATVCFPGGCKIGKRPINLHIEALQKMGAKIKTNGNKIVCTLNDKNFKGTTINLKFPSVGATQTIIIAATTAIGITKIQNAAIEPEIVELCYFLKKCGAKITGEGTKTIIVEGISTLQPTQYKIKSDRIVAATLICAVAATGGELFLKSTKPKNLNSILTLLQQMGCTVHTFNDGIFLKASKILKTNFTIKTQPYPGFPTDLQPIFMALTSITQGNTKFIETIFENRFQHVEQLKKFGAQIQLLNCHTAIVHGKPSCLHSACVSATDLRGGAGALIAALAAPGISTISNLNYINRGYENIEQQFKNLGACIFQTQRNF